MTGVICRVVTPKDKERYPSPLTKIMNTGDSAGQLWTYRTEKVTGVLHLKNSSVFNPNRIFG